MFYIRKDNEREKNFYQPVKQLIRVDQEYHSYFGTSILHISVTHRPVYVDTNKIPAYELVICLLKLGININMLKRNKETALLSLLKHKNNLFVTKRDNMDNIEKEWIEVVNILLEKGIDIDIRNKNNMTALSLFRDMDISVCEVKYRTLQCLAKHHQIDHCNKVPKRIETFINLH